MPISRIINPARSRLEAGELSLGVGIRQSRVVDVALIMKNAGMDWLFIDLEHSPMDLETAAQISMMALAVGISPIVRIPHGAFELASRALDAGALGIVVPHVESAEQARDIVQRLRYAPQGERGVSGMIPQFGYSRVDLREATTELNRSVLLVVMLETPEAVSHAEEIAAVDGIDVVMLGTNDFAMALGHPGQFGHPAVDAAYDTIAEACRKQGKWAGSGGLGDPKHFERCVANNVQFILAGSEAPLLMQAARERADLLRGFQGDNIVTFSR